LHFDNKFWLAFSGNLRGDRDRRSAKCLKNHPGESVRVHRQEASKDPDGIGMSIPEGVSPAAHAKGRSVAAAALSK
jgi:hypothetical protein